MNKYHNIVDYIMDEILNDTIRLEEKMPTVRALSEKFQCSKGTVVKAYEQLQKNHIIYSVPQKGYFLVKKNRLVEELKTGIIDFTSASPDESVLPYEDFQHCLNQAIDTYKHTLFNYSNPKGLPSLIRVLVKYLQEYQVFCKTENLFITAGAQQAIHILCTMHFPNDKTNILVEQPAYKGILKSLELNNIPVILIERGFDGIDIYELERKFATDNIKLFYTTPRYHNPLGVSYSNEEKKQIVKLADKYDVYIIEDDYLADLEIKNNSYPMYYEDTAERVIYMKSFSKILLPGLRIGAIVVPTILANSFEKNKQWADLGTTVLSQGALEIYIKSGMFKAHRKKIKKIYTQKMELLNRIAISAHIPDIQWHIPPTGFFACVEFLSEIDSGSIIKNLKERNILINHIKENYFTDDYNNKLLKISLSKANFDQINYGIRALLDEILKARNMDFLTL